MSDAPAKREHTDPGVEGRPERRDPGWDDCAPLPPEPFGRWLWPRIGAAVVAAVLVVPLPALVMLGMLQSQANPLTRKADLDAIERRLDAIERKLP